VTVQELAARLDRLPMSRFHRLIVVCLAFTFFCELADLNEFAYAAPGIIKFLHITVNDVAAITSAGFFGMFIGAASGGWIADLFGRRRGLIWSVIWFSVFSIINGLAFNVPTLLIARFLTGIGMSSLTVIGITYLAELMPKDRRGRLQAATLAIGALGVPIIAGVALLVVPLGPEGWRFVFVFGGCGLVLLRFTRVLPESPRWLLNQGQSEAAEHVVARLEESVVQDRGELPPITPANVPSEDQRYPLRVLFTGTFLRRTVMLWLVWIFQTLGVYGFSSWVPTLLAAHGFSLVKSLTFTFLSALGYVPGAFFAWPLSDRYGRRWPIVIVSILLALFGLLFGLSFNSVAIAVFGFLVSFFIYTFAALLYVYTPELYPTTIRNRGTGLAYGLGRAANIVGPLIVAFVLLHYGYLAVFVYLAIAWLMVCLLVGFLGVNTGKVSLEELNPVQERSDEMKVSIPSNPTGTWP